MTLGADAEAPRRFGGRRGLLLAPFVLFAALAVLFLFRLHAGDPSVLPSALIGRPAPDHALPPLEGLRADGQQVPGFSRADLTTGEVTLVNIFASWCGPCRNEHPLLVVLKDQGVRIFGLNYKDDPSNALRFMGALGNPYQRVGVDSGRAAIDWGMYGVPETYVVSGDGRIAYRFVGPLTPEAVATTLLPEIAKAKAVKPAG